MDIQPSLPSIATGQSPQVAAPAATRTAAPTDAIKAPSNAGALKAYFQQAQQDVETIRSGPAASDEKYQPSPEDAAEAERLYSGYVSELPRSPEAKAAIMTILGRLQQLEREAAAEGQPLNIDGVTPTMMFLYRFVGDPKVSDEMLLAMSSRVKLANVARTPEQCQDIEARVPGCRQLPSHRMAVALLSAITGIPADQLSANCPDLGLSGTPDDGLWEPGTGVGEVEERKGEFQLSNVLHDVTDYLQDAGVDGLNEAVWGHDDKLGSAIASWWEARWGDDRYPESQGGVRGW